MDLGSGEIIKVGVIDTGKIAAPRGKLRPRLQAADTTEGKIGEKELGAAGAAALRSGCDVTHTLGRREGPSGCALSFPTSVQTARCREAVGVGPG